MQPISAVLPSFLRPVADCDLIRIGRDNDGGYLVNKEDIYASEYLVALGVNEDWSFEQQFLSIHDVPVYAFDPTISRHIFRNRLAKAAIRFNRPRSFVHSLRVFRGYRKFFTGQRKHIEKYVGLDTAKNTISLNQVIHDFVKPRDRLGFMKIDIEGSEYRILEDIIENSDVIAGMVIEFHESDFHMDKIKDFIARFPLKLCHVHCNNVAPVNHERMPLVFECTFSRNTSSSYTGSLPHPLDMPNNPEEEEFSISFSG